MGLNDREPNYSTSDDDDDDDLLPAQKKRARRRQDAGRRLRGSHLYDSELGITCHFCRQKVIELHVYCCKCAIAFCGRCLRSRHGEDILIERAAGHWVCPKCRKGCGLGCKNCCNCGPCRSLQNLGPPRLSLTSMRAKGFDNIHDYLIHLDTGESGETILARKIGKGWCKTAEMRSKGGPANQNNQAQQASSQCKSGKKGEKHEQKEEMVGQEQREYMKERERIDKMDEKTVLRKPLGKKVESGQFEKKVEFERKEKREENVVEHEQIQHIEDKRIKRERIEKIEEKLVDRERVEKTIEKMVEDEKTDKTREKMIEGEELKKERKMVNHEETVKKLVKHEDIEIICIDDGDEDSDAVVGEAQSAAKLEEDSNMAVREARSAAKLEEDSNMVVSEAQSTVELAVKSCSLFPVYESGAESHTTTVVTEAQSTAEFAEEWGSLSPTFDESSAACQILQNDSLAKRQNKIIPSFLCSKEAYKEKLRAKLAQKFNSAELEDLWKEINQRKPIYKARETRHGTSVYATQKAGYSYLDHHPDLAYKMTLLNDQEEKLTLLRGFFFWLEHAGTPDAFKPWAMHKHANQVETDYDCLEIDGPDCQVLGVVCPVDGEKVDSVFGWEDCLGIRAKVKEEESSVSPVNIMEYMDTKTKVQKKVTENSSFCTIKLVKQEPSCQSHSPGKFMCDWEHVDTKSNIEKMPSESWSVQSNL